MYRRAIAGQHQQIGAAVVDAHQCQGAHAAGGADQTGGQAGTACGQLNRLAALAVQKAARIGPSSRMRWMGCSSGLRLRCS